MINYGLARVLSKQSRTFADLSTSHSQAVAERIGGFLKIDALARDVEVGGAHGDGRGEKTIANEIGRVKRSALKRLFAARNSVFKMSSCPSAAKDSCA
ncbi:MAG: hypothetical protein AAB354_00635 [candidate division KSB1 bacterium]